MPPSFLLWWIVEGETRNYHLVEIKASDCFGRMRDQTKYSTKSLKKAKQKTFSLTKIFPEDVISLLTIYGGIDGQEASGFC